MIPEKLVCFAHGKESGPWGIKISHLAGTARHLGYEVMSPDYSHTFDPHARVRQLLELAPKAGRSLVLAGSSMGGYVSAMACSALKPQALFLLAPALYFPGFDEEPADTPALTCVIHGWKDDVVPVERALRFARSRNAALHLLDSGHTLNDQLPALSLLFADLLTRADATEAATPSLESAYTDAHYVVLDAGQEIVLRCGVHDPQLEQRLGMRERCAIITPCNPASRQLSTAGNQERVERLARAVALTGLRSAPTVNRDPSGRWPDEAGFLLVDPPPGLAEDLGRRYGQSAILVVDRGQAPRLLWLGTVPAA